MCSDLSEVAGSVRCISEHCMTSNRERPSEDWLSRQWFTEDVSKCISSQLGVSAFRYRCVLICRRWQAAYVVLVNTV